MMNAVAPPHGLCADYIEHYRLSLQPFAVAPDERFFYPTPEQDTAFARLMHAARAMRGLATATGEIGTGKTTLALRLLSALREEEYEANLLIVTTPVVPYDWFLHCLTRQISPEPPPTDYGERIESLCQKLAEINRQGRKTVYLIDEAGMLTSPEVLGTIRGLLNVELLGEKLVTFILIGLPGLQETLDADPALRQRVAVRSSLGPFSEDQTRRYVQHRMEVAGGNGIINEEAQAQVFRFSRGVPRVINILCDNALHEGCRLGKSQIGSEEIETAALDLGLSGDPEEAVDSEETQVSEI
jgi:type II secretory pathway predicted ATPase ExeA